MRGWRARWLLAAWCSAWATSAAAQQTELAPSVALDCMTPPTALRQKMEYPPQAYERKDGGTVQVELVFTRADAPPRFELIDEDRQALDSLVDAVRQHVRAYRVPCMQEGQPPVTLRQQFVFVPNDGRKVMASPVRDQADPARRALIQCIAHVRGQKRPAYPESVRRDEGQGNYLVELTFNAADAPPTVRMLAAAPSRRLQAEVLDHLQGLRMPCLQGEPVRLSQIYSFRMDGGERTVLRDLTLLKLLGAARKPLPPAYLDLDIMGCPFDVRLSYFQPHRRNFVGELETRHPARKPLLDWLALIELDLPAATNTTVLGDETTVRIPCGTIDL
jgi:hypothetical protein